MYLFIANAGIDDHIAGIREELRYLGLLREKINLLYRRCDSTTAAPELLRRCVDEVKTLEESFQWRIDFLKSLMDDMQRINDQVGLIVEDIDQSLGEDGP